MGELDVSDILKDATIVYTFDAKTSQLQSIVMDEFEVDISKACLLYTSPSPRD